MIDTKQFYDYLISKEIDFFTGVPDSLLKNLCACIADNQSASKHIIAANEGNAISVAAGYHIATGKTAAVYMQNSGLGNAVNPLLSLTDEDVYKIPVMLIIGWRGQPGIKDEPQHKKQGKLTLGLLDTMGIRHYVLDDDFKRQIDDCCDYIRQKNLPVAIVVRPGSFSEYKLKTRKGRFGMLREEALEQILNCLSGGDFIVSTTGKTSREIFELREKRSEGHANDFLTVGSMGHAASIAFGMSLGCNQCIYCVDGDGSFLMHMGGMGIAAKNARSNFKYVLINNGSHESVGGQPTIGFDIDIYSVLKALGFAHVFTAKTKQEVAGAMTRLKDAHTGALIINVNTGSRKELGRPAVSPEQNKKDMMRLFESFRAKAAADNRRLTD
ncbi:MAG: phosphonopyruvate decarboxylase [Christensenellales bacterium]